MTAKDHNKIIGVLFLVQVGIGLMGLLIGILMFGFTGLAVVSTAHNGEDAAAGLAIFGILTVLLIFFSIFLLPALAAGFGMVKSRRWARTWAIVAACLSLLSFPLGTALGVYALWFLFGDLGKSFYSGSGVNTNTFNAPQPNSWR